MSRLLLGGFLSLLLSSLALGATLKNVPTTKRPYQFIFKNGRPRGGFLGHWNEDFSKDAKKVSEPVPGNKHLRILWFTQKLDHFNGFNTATWQQKYWINDQFYKPGGPVFIQLGGEGPTSRHWIDINEGTPDWLKNAIKFGALCIQLEHRYYGDSHPTSDTSTPNLRYLSSRQSLADTANFIETMNVQLGPQYGISNQTKWVTFGGSYSGALSGWFRLKYPHLVVGAVATSAPVQAEVDFRDYLGVVRSSLNNYDPNCLSQVQLATTTMQQLIQTPTGRQTLKTKLKLCESIDPTNSNDMMNLWSTLAGNFMGVVQYSQDNRGIYANKLTIPVVCGMMTNPSISSIMDRYMSVNKLILDSYGATCLDFSYSGMISALRNTNNTADTNSGRMWTYQTCTEFGYYQDSDLPNQPFGHSFPLKFSVQQCADIFGASLTADVVNNAIASTNLYYGGRNYKASNVIFPNGSVDPWHALGILVSPNPGASAAYILGTAHCANMYPSRANDPPELQYARHMITQSLQSWLS